MFATCNNNDPVDCPFIATADTLTAIGTLARHHEATVTTEDEDTGTVTPHVVTVYGPDRTIPRAEWELDPVEAGLVVIDTAERIGDLAAVALEHGQLDEARRLIAALLDTLTRPTVELATADPRRYALVAGQAQRHVDQVRASAAQEVRAA